MLGVLVSMGRHGGYQGGHGCGDRGHWGVCPWVWRETDYVRVSTGMGKGGGYLGCLSLRRDLGSPWALGAIRVPVCIRKGRCWSASR